MHMGVKRNLINIVILQSRVGLDRDSLPFRNLEKGMMEEGNRRVGWVRFLNLLD